ncbi:MAG: radical SAM protein [Thiohalomonadales bacterium]
MIQNAVPQPITIANNLEFDWFKRLAKIQSFSDIHIDRDLLRRAQSWHSKNKLADILNLHIPSIKAYSSEEIPSCGVNLWPAISITGDKCSLMCDHCQANVLKGMIPAKTAQELWQVSVKAVMSGARGLLLSGGSNLQNEVDFSPYLETIQKLKKRFPQLILSCHTGLVDAGQAKSLEQAGIDCAMIDVIGSQDTITQVYHLRRAVEDFETALQALTQTTMFVIPHIVLGLHYGKLLGEWQAIEMIRRQGPDAVVLVVAMPHFATQKRPYSTLSSNIIGQFFYHARQVLADLPLLLGCARPAGTAKLEIDTYALCVGLDGIAYPAEGIVAMAKSIGKASELHYSCCSVIPEMIAKTRARQQ